MRRRRIGYCYRATFAGDGLGTSLRAVIVCFCSVVHRGRRLPPGIRCIRSVGALFRLIVLRGRSLGDAMTLIHTAKLNGVELGCDRRSRLSRQDQCGESRRKDGRKAGSEPAYMQFIRGDGDASRYSPPYELVCCIRVASESPATVLPLWKLAALASGATAADSWLRSAKAARIRFFIGILRLWSGKMSDFN
jgi:hypothetical protein